MMVKALLVLEGIAGLNDVWLRLVEGAVDGSVLIVLVNEVVAWYLICNPTY